MTKVAVLANAENENGLVLSHRLLFLLSFIAGIVLTLSFAPFNAYPLGFISIGVFYWICDSCVSIKKTLYFAFIYGIGFFGVSVSWVFVSIHTYGHLNYFLSALITLIFILYLALFPTLTAFVYKTLSFSNAKLIKAFIFASCWVATEILRANLFTGFPWVLIGFSQVATPLKGLLPIVGIYGVSFYVCIIAAFISNMASSDTKKVKLAWCGFAVLLLVTPKLTEQMQWENIAKKSIPVAVVQANISMRDKWDDELFVKILNKYGSYISSLIKRNRVLILPESAIPAPINYINEYIESINKLAKENNTAVLLGTLLTDNDNKYQNALISLGNAKGSYVKRHLVPFGEWIPESFKRIFDLLSLPNEGLIKGYKEQELVRAVYHPLAVLICYELAYPNLLKNQLPQAEWIVSISDIGWFGKSLAIYQHLQMAQAVSLLSARYQIVANNDGLSAIIDTKGRIEAKLPAFKEGVLESTIYPATGVTPWSYLGDVPIMLLCAVVLFFSLYQSRKKARSF